MKIFIIVPLDFKISRNPPVARLVRASTDRNPPTLGGGGCQVIQRLVGAML